MMPQVPLRFAVLGLTLLAGLPARCENEPSSVNNSEMKQFLAANPQADADGDGVLTLSEFEAYLPQNVLQDLANRFTHRSVTVSMRDGYACPAEVFLPKEPRARLPVVLTRTAYSRLNLGGYVRAAVVKGGVGFVAMDARRYDDGRHPAYADPQDSTIDLNDMWDTLEWIKAQPWSDGRVMTIGGSGNGQPACMGFWCDHPCYTINRTGNTAGNTKYYWFFQNGCARGEYGWIVHRGGVPSRVHPTLPTTPYQPDEWMAFIRAQARSNTTWYSGGRGWYDPLVQGALDDFTALQGTGRAFVTIGATGHGGLSGFGEQDLRMPLHRKNPMPNEPDFEKILRGEAPTGTTSTLKYFLMGDVRDSTAPGNEWRFTHVWPVPHTDTPYYLRADGTLTLTPSEGEGSAGYRYDPKDPAPTLGGHWTWAGDANGPHDQRELHRRKDVLYAVTAPLSEPVNVTGRIGFQLYFKTDVRDTGFVVKLIDVYPDGYEAIVRETAGMGRYWNGYREPKPLETGKVYGLTLDMWSTAVVFNKGHRIGVIVTGSSKDSYEVHPNTWEQVPDYTASPVATHEIQMSKEHPTHIVLPVVKEEPTRR